MIQLTYQLLESKMVTYQNLIKVKVKDNGVPLIFLNNQIIASGYLPSRIDMQNKFGNIIILRESLVSMLEKAQILLQVSNQNLELFVTYGFRSLEIQTQRFLEQAKVELKKFYENPFDLYEEVHRYIAVPTVSGHPTGGAVDVVLRNKITKKIVDCGSDIYDYSNKDCYTYSPFISKKAETNRIILRTCMLDAGFAPFDGEWWHFSYGDREWAYYFKKPFALYEQKTAKLVLQSLHNKVR